MTTLMDEVNRRNLENQRLKLENQKLNLENINIPHEDIELLPQMNDTKGKKEKITLMEEINRRGGIGPKWPYQGENLKSEDNFGIDNIEIPQNMELSEEEVSDKEIKELLPYTPMPISNKRKRSGKSKKSKKLTKAKKKARTKARTKAKRDLMKAKKTLKRALARYNKVMKM